MVCIPLESQLIQLESNSQGCGDLISGSDAQTKTSFTVSKTIKDDPGTFLLMVKSTTSNVCVVCACPELDTWIH